MNFLTRPAIRAVLYYALCFVAPLGILAAILDLPHQHLGLPICFSQDAIFQCLFIKPFTEGQSPANITALAAPYAHNAFLFPMNETFDHGVAVIIACIVKDAPLALNLAWFFKIMTAGLLAAWSMRLLGVSAPVSFWAAILFALCPYALFRNVSHFNVATQFVPPMAALSLLMLSGDFGRLSKQRKILLCVMCILAGLSDLYVVAFTAFLFSAVIVAVGALSSSPKRAAMPALALALLLSSACLNGFPAIRARAENPRAGKIIGSMRGDATESNVYCLRLWDLLMPVKNHPLAPFRKATSTMTETLPQERGEHETVPLGLFSALGFLSLLLALMACGVFEPNPRLCSLADRLKYPAILSVLLILLSVSHGFSNFIAVHISPSIRVYARVSIFINFFGLYASAVIIDGCYGAFAPHGSVLRKSVALLFVLFLLFLGVCDQKNTIAGETDSYAQTWKAQIPRFEELRSLVGTVEKRLAKDAMVYQLPATLPIDKADYWHLYQLAPYAVSHHLRWSFAPFTFTDRASDWHNGVRRMPPEQFLDAILKAGFKGVWIDKSRYIEEQSDSETVRYLLGHEGVSVIDSAPNGLYSFVDLTSIPVSVQSVLDAGPVELLAASSDFLSPAWVGKNAQTERDGEHRYKVQLAPDGVFEQSVPMATVAGDKLAGSLEVSSPEKCNVTVYLKRGDVGPFDGEIRTIALSPGEPSVFELSHTFVKSWDSVIFGVGAPKGATLFIKNAQLKRVEPTAPPSTK